MSLQRGVLNQEKGFIKRWPSKPKIAFMAQDNCFQDEIMRR